MVKVGDRVLLPGEVVMQGIGIDDESVLVKLGDGGFIKISEKDLIEAQPKPVPENIACVQKDDLVQVVQHFNWCRDKRLVRPDAALDHLRAHLSPMPMPSWTQLPNWPPQRGDVWKDMRDGSRWIGVERWGEITLQTDAIPGVTVTGEQRDALAPHLELAWRDEP